MKLELETLKKERRKKEFLQHHRNPPNIEILKSELLEKCHHYMLNGVVIDGNPCEKLEEIKQGTAGGKNLS